MKKCLEVRLSPEAVQGVNLSSFITIVVGSPAKVPLQSDDMAGISLIN
jgi:hypothetical protein